MTDLNPSDVIVKTCIASPVDCVLDRIADALEGDDVPFGRNDRVNTVRTAIDKVILEAVRGTDASGWAIKGQVLITLQRAIDASVLPLTTDSAARWVGTYVYETRDKRKVVRALRRAARLLRSEH